MGLEGKVAIISGGNRGIGNATSRLFAKEGAKVVVAARDSGSGESTVAGITNDGGIAHFIRADVAQADDVDRIVAETVERFGGVDIVINNAAIDPWKPLLETTVEEWDACLDINLRGSFLLARASVPHMLERGGGNIVNTSSVLALGALPRSGAYVASKAGVMGLTRAMVVEWTELGIRVNCILPGSTDTDMMWYGLTVDQIPAEREAVAADIPVGRVAAPEEIAQASLWLCTPGASYVSGAFLLLDGGQTSRATSPR